MAQFSGVTSLWQHAYQRRRIRRERDRDRRQRRRNDHRNSRGARMVRCLERVADSRFCNSGAVHFRAVRAGLPWLDPASQPLKTGSRISGPVRRGAGRASSFRVKRSNDNVSQGNIEHEHRARWRQRNFAPCVTASRSPLQAGFVGRPRARGSSLKSVLEKRFPSNNGGTHPRPIAP